MATPSLPGPIPLLLERLRAASSSDLFARGHPDLFLARAPAGLDVMGGIADVAGGLACAYPLDLGAAVAVQRRDDRRILIHSFNLPNATAPAARVELSLDDFYGTAALLPTDTLRNLFPAGNHWAAYIAGAFPVLARHKNMTRRTAGANIACFSTAPLGAGVGSSAALAVATLSALTAAYHLLLEPLETAVLAERIEHLVVGNPSGIIAPATAMLAEPGHLLVMRAQPHDLEPALPLGKRLTVAGVTIAAPNPQSAGAAYRRARAQAAIAHAFAARMYRDLGVRKLPTAGYLANVPLPVFTRYLHCILPQSITGKDFLTEFGPVPDRQVEIDPAATYAIAGPARHHIEETHRTRRFLDLLRTAESAPAAESRAAAIDAGRLMGHSHASYRDNLHLHSPAADIFCEFLHQRGPDRGLYGARITGDAAGDLGITLALLLDNTPAAHTALHQLAADFTHQTTHPTTLHLQTSPGAAATPAQKIPLSQLRPK